MNVEYGLESFNCRRPMAYCGLIMTVLNGVRYTKNVRKNHNDRYAGPV